MRTPLSRMSALILTLALVATGAPALAADDEETPLPAEGAAVVGLTTPTTLTLPAGDGVRDATTVTLTSDVATEVTIDILAADGTTALRSDAASLEEGALSASIGVEVDGLPAGALTLRATPAVGDPVTVPLTIGSGRPASVSLALSAKTIYSWSKGAAPTTIASVSAVDETGEKIAFTGSVTAKAGGKTQTVPVTSTTGATAKATISGAKLAAGTGTVTARVSGNASSPVASPAAPLTVRATTVTSTKLAVSQATVYPSKDGYKDSTKITVTTSTSTGKTVPTTGTVKVTRNGKTVTSWKLTSSKTWSATWNGKVKGKIVPGTYTVSVSVKGPEGAAKTASKKVTVKKGVLVTKTTSTWVSAQKVFDEWMAFDDKSACTDVGSTTVRCRGRSVDFLSVAAMGTVSVPRVVRDSYKYGDGSVRVVLSATESTGLIMWGYSRGVEDEGKTGFAKKGDHSLGRHSLGGAARTIELVAILFGTSVFAADKVKFEYSYKVLSTK